MRWRTLVIASVLALLALFPSPAAASHTFVHERCQRLTYHVNLWREPNLRTVGVLCDAARAHLRDMAASRRIFHTDLSRVARMLNERGICWRWVGEVIAWNNYERSAREFVRQWRVQGPTSHWPILMAPRADWGGGYYASVWQNVAVYYVIDRC